MADVRTVICGSPQRMGKCAQAAKRLCGALQARFPGDRVDLFGVAELDMSPCLGCNHCLSAGRCFMEDDMADVLASLQKAVALYVVCPVYFSGPPAQMKALYDRFQPLFGSYDPAKTKRPASLMVVGDGGDPHGWAPLEGISRSALAVAGFRLERVLPCIGAGLEEACALAESLAAR